MAATGRLRRVVQNLILVGVATALTLAAGDRYVASAGLDQARMARSLYYQNAYVPVHEILPDSPLHYVLKAGAVFDGQGQYGPYHISINAHRARGTEYPITKGQGVFRILCFGPSTTFGADVDDDQSIPAQLETYLKEQLAAVAGGGAPTVEVWNFGTSAYVPIQTALLAMEKLELLRPDMIIMTFNNAGRRAFLNVPGADQLDYLPWFEADPTLWEENFPPPPGRSPSLHRLGMSWSAFYRYVIAQQVLERTIEVGPRQGEVQGRELSGRLVQKAAAAGVPLVVVSWSGENAGNYPGVPETHLINTFDRPVIGLDAHPPAPVLGQIGRRIGSSLLARGLIPGAQGLVVTPTEVDVSGVLRAPGSPPLGPGGPAPAPGPAPALAGPPSEGGAAPVGEPPPAPPPGAPPMGPPNPGPPQ